MRLDPLSAINRDARMLVGVARFRQGRFAEALSLLNEANSPHPYATLIQASVLAHLGQLTAAAEALARYRATATPSAEAVTQSYFLHPEHQKRFLNGIAMADGKVPPDENMGV